MCFRLGAQGIRSRKAPVIKMDNVVFTYPSATTPTLNNANIRLGMGSRCALLGKNGAGKTTLMRILVGELECDEDKGARRGSSFSVESISSA
jgi:ABC-type bacteriocin/lantibiotic exporter with double-glycine peptidase domain